MAQDLLHGDLLAKESVVDFRTSFRLEWRRFVDNGRRRRYGTMSSRGDHFLGRQVLFVAHGCFIRRRGIRWVRGSVRSGIGDDGNGRGDVGGKRGRESFLVEKRCTV